MWLRATTSLWFSGQFELYPTNITASYEASEFCWQNALISLYNIWGYVLSRWICDWEPPQNNRPSQDQAKTDQVSEENKSLIVSSISGKNTQKLLFLFLQFAKTHNKILTDFLQKVAICKTDVPDHASTTPTHPRSGQSPSTVRITKTKIEYYIADDALIQIIFATQGDFRGLVPSENGDNKTGAAFYVESDFDLNIVCRV